MPIADDISVATNGDIRYTGTTANYSGIVLHRFLQDLADNIAVAGDDLLDITSPNPTDRKTDNYIELLAPYNIDDVLSQHLYDASIVQNGGADIYDAIVNFGKAGVYIDVIQNGALLTNFWTTGLNADANAGISHRFLIKTRTAGADIDGRRLIGVTREFGFTYGEFKINGTSRGNNVLALTNSADLNNKTAEGTVAGWTTITNIEGYRAIDVNGDGTPEFYYSEWNRDTYTINQFFERMKWLTRRGTAEIIYGLPAGVFRGITHELDVDGQAVAVFSAVEPLSWTGGTGQLLAVDDVNAASKMWIQLLTGVPPVDNEVITGSTSGATCLLNVTVAEQSVSTPFVGASTGSAIVGSFGLGIEATDLSALDLLFDLTGTANNPPNNVTFTVAGLEIGDTVLVAPELNGDIETGQLTLSGAHTAGQATVTVTAPIPTDTPSSGTIRVSDGVTQVQVAYTSYSGSIFSGCTGVPTASDLAEVFISYIDEVVAATSVSFTAIYDADRPLVVLVRAGGASPIKPFATTATLGSSGGAVTAIRTSDI